MDSTAGYSGTPLVRKLGLKRGMRVRILKPPEDYWQLLGVDPTSMELVELPKHGDQRADFTHLFADDSTALDEGFIRGRQGMSTDGMIWVSWPKKSSGVPSGIGRDNVMTAGKRVGLVDVKVCAVDDTWSGLKFVIPVADRVDEGGG